MSNLCAFLLEDALRHNGQAMIPVHQVNGVRHAQDGRPRQSSPF
ncbi:MAG: hypothetical protein ACKOZT_05380 [Cyanobium sp.]